MNIQQVEFYRDGVIDNLPVFALYDPVGNCFLTVLPNQTVAQHLKYLVSSRYHLHVCRLDLASNYTHGMLTNANCELWSLTNHDSIAFSNPISTDVVTVTELTPTTATPDYDVFGEKLWCLYCTHYLYILDNEHDATVDPFDKMHRDYSKLDEYLNSFLNINSVGYASTAVAPEIKNKILQLLYLYRGDIFELDQEIKQLL